MGSSFSQGFSVLFTAFVLAVALGSPNDLRGATGHDRLYVQICDTTGLSPEALDLIERETASIYEKAGAEIVWLRGCQPIEIAVDQVNVARAFILPQIPASLVPHLERYSGEREQVMGYVLCDGQSTPGSVAYISREAIESKASGHDSVALNATFRGRALGRVLAHELAHRFLVHIGHDRKGVLKPTFSQQELTDFNPKCFYLNKKHLRTLQETMKAGEPSELRFLALGVGHRSS